MNRSVVYTCMGLAVLCLAGCVGEELPLGAPIVPGLTGGAGISATTNSGCLNVNRGEEPEVFDTDAALDAAGTEYPGCANEAVTLTAGVGTIDVVHSDATYNCCAEADEITIAMAIDGTTITLTETATVANPCRCLCCFDVEATVSDLDPGTYTVELCWEDHETGGELCDTQTVTVE